MENKNDDPLINQSPAAESQLLLDTKQKPAGRKTGHIQQENF